MVPLGDSPDLLVGPDLKKARQSETTSKACHALMSGKEQETDNASNHSTGRRSEVSPNLRLLRAQLALAEATRAAADRLADVAAKMLAVQRTTLALAEASSRSSKASTSSARTAPSGADAAEAVAEYDGLAADLGRFGRSAMA